MLTFVMVFPRRLRVDQQTARLSAQLTFLWESNGELIFITDLCRSCLEALMGNPSSTMLRPHSRKERDRSGCIMMS